MTYMILGPILGLVTGAAGVLFFKWRTRVELDAKKETQQLDAQAVPIQMLREELAKSQALVAELLADAREDRRQHADMLGAIKGGIEAISNRLDASAEESRENAKVTHERLLVIETQLGIKRTA